jgi:hypothetical protein
MTINLSIVEENVVLTPTEIENQFELTVASVTSWGNIIGSIVDQIDLQTILTAMDDELVNKQDALGYVPATNTRLDIQGLIVSGSASIGNNIFPPGVEIPWASTLYKLSVRAGNAPVGANMIIDFRLDASSLGIVTILDGALSGNTDIVSAVTAGQILTWNITQVGSTNPGSNVWVKVSGS